MINVYIGELISNKTLPILNRQLSKEKYTGVKAYRAIFDELDFSFINIVNDPEHADFLLIPHNYSVVRNNKLYLNHFVAHAEKYNKKILIFASGDSEEEINIPHAFVFRNAGYRHEIKEPEIIIPAQIYAGDILNDQMFFLREKKEKPVVSFCGWAGLNSFSQRVKYVLGIFLCNIQKYIFFNAHAETHKQGLYWRRKAFKTLRDTTLVRTSFLIRNFYAANKSTVQGDPKVLRREYINNIHNSDFVLAPRGDGNYSVRFYEALALGRVPILIDTDCVLPLEDVIDYKKFVVFVPYKDIKNTDKYIREFWDKLTNEEFHAIQKLARDTFMKYLKFDSFLRYIFENKLKS